VKINLIAAWIGFLLGCAAGAIPGLLFDREGWLGGYSSWRRRLIRLAHISFFGLGLINLSFVLSARFLEIKDGLLLASWLLLAAAVTMPLICYLSAVNKLFRHLFFIPAGSVMLGIIAFLWRILIP
jgi:hypothetical protein